MELPQKRTTIQTESAEFQVPSIDGGRKYRFAGTDCVSTLQEGLYQSLENRRHFFVTVEDPCIQVSSPLHYSHMVVLPVRKYIEALGKEKQLDVEVHFFIENEDGPPVASEYKRIWTIRFRLSRASTNIVAHDTIKCINVDSYTGSNQQIERSQPVIVSCDEANFALNPYEGNRYLFKIKI